LNATFHLEFDGVPCPSPPITTVPGLGTLTLTIDGVPADGGWDERGASCNNGSWVVPGYYSFERGRPFGTYQLLVQYRPANPGLAFGPLPPAEPLFASGSFALLPGAVVPRATGRGTIGLGLVDP